MASTRNSLKQFTDQPLFLSMLLTIWPISWNWEVSSKPLAGLCLANFCMEFNIFIQRTSFIGTLNHKICYLTPTLTLKFAILVLFESNAGLSAKIDSETKPKTVCGSDTFKSPEMLMKKNYNGVMNDLFAVGVTIFILMTGKAPFNNANPNTGLYQFVALNYPDKFWKVHDKKSKYSPEFKNLIGSMLAFDPTHRLSIAEILSHPWMTQETLMGNEL